MSDAILDLEHYLSYKGYDGEIKKCIDYRSKGMECNFAYSLARKGNLKWLKYLLQEKDILRDDDIDFIRRQQRTQVLFNACLSGNVDLVKFLIEEKKFKLDTDYEIMSNFNIEAILFPACKSGSLELVKYLIGLGEDINVTDSYGNTILFEACESGSVYLVKWLLEEKKMEIRFKNNEEQTILFPACKSGCLELVKYLIGLGEDINAIDSNNETILFNACRSGNLELVKYLVENKNMDVNAMEGIGISLLYQCRLDGCDKKIITYLKRKGAIEDALFG